MQNKTGYTANWNTALISRDQLCYTCNSWFPWSVALYRNVLLSCTFRKNGWIVRGGWNVTNSA